MLRVGHGGAGALVRANTIESFDAALELGVDMIEFDVRAHRRRLVVAHAPWDPRRPDCPSLTDALRHLSGRRFAGVSFDVDVKMPGVEAATLYALESFGLTDRCLISSRLPRVLDRVRELDPSVRTGVSIPRHARRWRRAVLDGLTRRRFDDVMAHHRLVDARLVDEVRARAGQVFAWTIDDPGLLARMREAGASGAITNDPRLFATLPAG